MATYNYVKPKRLIDGERWYEYKKPIPKKPIPKIIPENKVELPKVEPPRIGPQQFLPQSFLPPQSYGSPWNKLGAFLSTGYEPLPENDPWRGYTGHSAPTMGPKVMQSIVPNYYQQETNPNGPGYTTPALNGIGAGVNANLTLGPWVNPSRPWVNPSGPWVNPFPEQHNRPAYFNNKSTPADFYRWLDSFEDPEKAIEAIETIEKDYQQYAADVDAIMTRNEERYSNEPPKKPPSFWERIGATPMSDVFGEALGIGWEDPGINPETLYGWRYSQELQDKNYANHQDRSFLAGYRDWAQDREEFAKLIQLETALTRASPLFQPILDEQGNVLAAPLFTPDEYVDGLTEGTIYDPNMPDSKFKYGKTALVYAAIPGEPGLQLLPAEAWYRSQDRLLMGNNYSGFTDQYGYTHFNKSYLPNVTSSDISAKNMGVPIWDFNPANFAMGPFTKEHPAPRLNAQYSLQSTTDYQNVIDYQKSTPWLNLPFYGPPAPGQQFVDGQPAQYAVLPALTPEETQTPTVEPPAGDGGWGGWGGWGDSGGYGPSYWGNPNSSGYYGSGSYSPDYWGDSGGYGSGGYSGGYSNDPNYHSNQYGTRKGQYFSQLARWVI